MKRTFYELCLDYLDMLNIIALDHCLTPVETFLKNSMEIRTEMADILECDVKRLTMVTNRLEDGIDFIPPLKIHESARVYAGDLERLLTCAPGRMFLSGKTQRLTTLYDPLNALKGINSNKAL